MTGLKMFVTGLALFFAVVSFAQAAPAPEGFEWQPCDGARLSILKPSDWHFRQGMQGGTYLCSVSEENVDESGPFRTGLMVNYVTDIPGKESVSASKFAARFVKAASETQEVIRMEAPSMVQVPDYGPVQMFVCRVRGKVANDRIIQHYVLLADDRAGNMHLMYYESPEAEWEDAWKIGKTILDNLQFLFQGIDDDVSVGDTVVVTTVMGSVDRGEHLKVNKVSGDWLGVSWGDTQSWIHRRDVRPLQQAAEFFTEALRRERSSQNYLHRGSVSTALGDASRAINDFDKAIRIDSKLVAAWYKRGNARRVASEAEKALADYTTAIRLDPKHAGAYHNRGMIWYERGDYDKAIADLSKTIRFEPEYVYAYLNRGGAYRKKGDWSSAVADCTEALRLDPEMSAAYENRGSVWADLGEFDKAISDYSKAIKFDPQLASAYTSRGDAWSEKGDYAKAIGDYTEAIQLDANFKWAYNGRGHAWRSKGEYARAIADYTQVVQLNPTYAPAFNNRAVSRLQIGELEKALADFNEAIRIDPAFAPAYRDRGAYGARSGKYAEAIADFDESIRRDPTDPLAYSNRGAYWKEQKQYEKAIADLTEAIRLNPRFVRAYGILAWLRATCPDSSYRNGDEAVRLAQRACELTGRSDAAHLDTLAAAYAELGDFPSAVKWQKKAIEIDADDNMRTRLSLYEAGKPFHATSQE